MNKGLLSTNQGTGDPTKFQRSDGTWALPPVGPVVTAPASGERFTGQYAYGNTSTANTLGDMYFMPLYVSASFTVNTIWCVVDSALSTAVIRLGIYTADSSNKPSMLVVDAGTVDASTTGVKSIAISQALTANTLYYCSAVNQTAAANWRGYSSAYLGPAATANNNLVVQTPGNNVYKNTGVTAALPGTTTLTFAGNISVALIPSIALTRA